MKSLGSRGRRISPRQHALQRQREVAWGIPGSTENSVITLANDGGGDKKRTLAQLQSLDQSPRLKRRAANKLGQEPRPGRQTDEKLPQLPEQGEDPERQLSQKQESLASFTGELSALRAETNATIQNLQDDEKSMASMASEIVALREKIRDLEAQVGATTQQAIAAKTAAKTNKQTTEKREIGLSKTHTEITPLRVQPDKVLQAINGSHPQRLPIRDETMEARLMVISQEVVTLQSQLRANNALIRRQKGLIDELRQQRDSQAEQLATANEEITKLTKIVADFWD